MAKGCFCHFNGYEVKDAFARRSIEELKKTMNGTTETATTTARAGALLQVNTDSAGVAEFAVAAKFVKKPTSDYVVMIGDKLITNDNYLYVVNEVTEGKLGLSGECVCTLINDFNSAVQENPEQGSTGTAAAASEIPNYWMEELKAKAKKINDKIMAAGANKSAFLCYTDAHWTSNAQISTKLLDYLYKHTGMNKVIFCGDIIDNEDEIDYAWDWRAAVRGLPNHHSVPGNHDDGNTENGKFSAANVYGFLIAPEETPDMVMGGDGLYYYIDRPEEKTRYLYLDTACYGVNNSQISFVTDALKSTPAFWHIVAVAHMWYDANYETSPATVGGMNAQAKRILDVFDNYNRRAGDFSGCTAWVEFCVGGHTHMEFRSNTAGGIPIILLCTDSTHTRSGTAHEAGTTREAAVYGIIANFEDSAINIIGVGRGGESWVLYNGNPGINIDGEISGDEPLAGTYNNILTDPAIGYQADTEISTSSGTERASSGGYDLTGKIYVNPGDVIRLKNVVMPDGVTDRRNYVYFFNADNSFGGNCCMTTTSTDGGEYYAPVFKDGNLAEFTIREHFEFAYIRINAQQIDDTSIITVNQEIA